MVRPRKPSTTIRDVARACGVSVGTVSRTLNSPDKVHPATLKKVRATLASMAFKPDPRAQNMRRRRTQMVGIIVNDLANPANSVVITSAEGELRERGYSVTLINTGGNPRREAEAIEFLENGRADGLILTINNERDRLSIDRLNNLSIPAVLLDREMPIKIDAVLTDHATGMRQAVEYLLDLGHRRIGLITAGQEIRPGRERIRGYVEAFQGRSLKYRQELLRTGSLSADFGLREASTLLQMPDAPTALIAGGNQILAGTLMAMQQFHIEIPAQISLLTCDRTDLSTIYPGPLTILDRDLAEAGKTAARLLVDRMTGANDGPARRILLPTSLFLGQSCAAPATKDSRLRKGLA